MNGRSWAFSWDGEYSRFYIFKKGVKFRHSQKKKLGKWGKGLRETKDSGVFWELVGAFER